MIVATDYAEITVDQSPLRMFLAAPKTESKKKFPGIIFFFRYLPAHWTHDTHLCATCWIRVRRRRS